MPESRTGSRHLRLWASAALIALAAAGCNRGAQQGAVDQIAPPKAALPLTTAAPPPSAPAPQAAALPPAPPARVARLRDPGERYAYADLAYDMTDAFGDAPPDYAYDYEGVRPWVWEGDDGGYEVVEPLPEGNRYYFYRPGDDAPFLIRDPDYAYGFDNGQLVVVYDRSGRALSFDEADRRAAQAGRMLFRASALFEAARRGQRHAVAQENWVRRQQTLRAERQAWADQQQNDEAWRAYHAAHAAEQRDRWAGERMRRAAEAARVYQATNNPAAAAQARQRAEAERTFIQQRRNAPGTAPRPPMTQARNAAPPPPSPGERRPPAPSPAAQPPAMRRGGPNAGQVAAAGRETPPRPGAPQAQPAETAQRARRQAALQARRQAQAQTRQQAASQEAARRAQQTSRQARQQAELQTRRQAETQARQQAASQEAARRAQQASQQARQAQQQAERQAGTQARQQAASQEAARRAQQANAQPRPTPRPAGQAQRGQPPEHGREQEHRPVAPG